MSKESDQLADAILQHGELHGSNLVHLKKFLAAKQEEQQAFLSNLQAASDRAQRRAAWAAIAAAVAALASAVASGFQAYAAWDALTAAIPGPTDGQMRVLEEDGTANSAHSRIRRSRPTSRASTVG